MEQVAFIVAIACVYVDANDENSVLTYKQFCDITLPVLRRESDCLIVAGYVPEPLLMPYPDNTIVIKFTENKGKSAYINAALSQLSDDKMTYSLCDKESLETCHILTIDCDIFPINRYIGLRQMSKLLSTTTGIGIIAPKQYGDNRHLATIYSNVSILTVDNDQWHLYWSDEVPSSVAGGCWMFPMDPVYIGAGPFDDFGEYGPEDVFFARRVAGTLGLRCCMVDELQVYHCDEGLRHEFGQ
jgi:hypothetical protein